MNEILMSIGFNQIVCVHLNPRAADSVSPDSNLAFGMLYFAVYVETYSTTN